MARLDLISAELMGARLNSCGMAGLDPMGAKLRGEHLNSFVMAVPRLDRGIDPATYRRTCLARWPGQARP